MAQSLILTRANLSRRSGQWREDDYDVLENGVVAAAFSSSMLSDLKAAPGCGRAGITATSNAQRTAMSRRASRRWRRSRNHGTGILGCYVSSNAIVGCNQQRDHNGKPERAANDPSASRYAEVFWPKFYGAVINALLGSATR
jgi:hypothetical protein